MPKNLGAFALDGTVTPAQITATQDNYAPTNNATASVFRISGDAIRVITGLAGGYSGRVVVLRNIGAFNFTLNNEAAGSTAANRFNLNAATVTIFPDDSQTLIYDGATSRWIPVGKGKTSFAVSGTILNPTAGQNIIAMNMAYPCIAYTIRGHRKGGTGATVNARAAQANTLMASDMSLSAGAGTWFINAVLQNTLFNIATDLELMVVTVTGAVTEITIQVEFYRDL